MASQSRPNSPRGLVTLLAKMHDEQSGVLIRQMGSSDIDISSLKSMKVQSTVCVPLWTRDRIMGFLSLDIIRSQRIFTRDHLDALVAVAHQVAVGLERARYAETAERDRKQRDYLCQYLDDKLIQTVMESQDDIDPLAPREQVLTIMFSDIVSFTKMSERMQPTSLAEFIRDHLSTMTDILFAHNGTIDKYIGDAVMALFGAPLQDADAPKNAVLAALAMRDKARLYEKRPVELRFGIATGPAVVGNIGSQQRVEYTALGDTVNVGSRLEAFARPGEIIIDETTRVELDDAFTVETIGTIDVKNRVESLKVYRVLAKSTTKPSTTCLPPSTRA